MMSVEIFYVLIIVVPALLISGMFVGDSTHQDWLVAICIVCLCLYPISFILGVNINEEVGRTEMKIIDVTVDSRKTFKVVTIDNGESFTLKEAKYVNNKLKTYKIENENRWGHNSFEYEHVVDMGEK